MYAYLYSLHVSGNHVPIMLYVTLCGRPSGMQVGMKINTNLHARRSSTQSDIYQVSHWYNNSPDDGHMVARNM